jgi:hypothetical protein
MSTTFSGLSRTVVIAVAYGASVAALAAHAQRPVPPPQAIPSQLLSDDERIEFCTQMHDASTPEERRKISERMRATLVPRARSYGVTLPAWLLDAQPIEGRGGDIPGLGCQSGRARPRTQNTPPAHAAPDHAMPTHEAPARETPVRNPPASGTSIQGTPAQNTPPQTVPDTDIPVGHDHGIPYVTGGVGQDEATALRRLAPSYSMRATFTSVTGEYLSGVAVQVSRSDGSTVFTAVSQGPYLFARLPSGHYRVVARFNGVERSRDVYVPTRGSVRFAMVWPALRAASGG